MIAATDRATRVVILTGAASGIGATTAQMLTRNDRHIILVDRNPDVVEQARTLQGYAGAEGVVVDLSDMQAVRNVAAEIASRHGRMDILINNAGIHIKRDGTKYKADEITQETWQTTLTVNLTAPFLLAQAALPLMKEQNWGRIVNVVSRAGRTYSAGGSAPYDASKAGLIGLSRTLAGEYGPFGITVNCVAPGRIATPLSRQGVGIELNEQFAQDVPVRRVGTAQDIAAAIAYFSSDDAGFVTGAILDVNGGGFMG